MRCRRKSQGLSFQANSVYNTHMSSKDLIRKLRADGWILDRVSGSHHVYKHPRKTGHIGVPHPKKDLGKRLVSKLLKFAGLRG